MPKRQPALADQLRLVARRNADRLAAAKAAMGERYVLHPANRVQRINHAPVRLAPARKEVEQ